MIRYKKAKERQRVYDVVGDALLTVMRPKHKHHSVCPRCDPMDTPVGRKEEPEDKNPWQAVHRICWKATVSQSRDVSPKQRRELLKDWARHIKAASDVMERKGCQIKRAFDTIISEYVMLEDLK